MEWRAVFIKTGKIIRISFCIIAGIILISSCRYRISYDSKKTVTLPQEEQQNDTQENDDKSSIVPPTITIWVHGTRFTSRLPHRRDSYCKSGLVSVNNLEDHYTLYILADTLIQADPDMFPKEHFYLLGWSGKLSFDEREQAAQQLYKDLKQLIKSYEVAYSVKPYIRMMAHSHGGNVVLNLATIKNPQEQDLIITELILLACPVQEKTMHYIQDPMFKKIYSIYSCLDIMQVIDPQGLYEKTKQASAFFSQRRFLPQQNLTQIKIKINGRALLHREFIYAPFLTYLPRIINTIDTWQQEDLQYPPLTSDSKRLLCVYTNGKRIKKRKKQNQNTKRVLSLSHQHQYQPTQAVPPACPIAVTQ